MIDCLPAIRSLTAVLAILDLSGQYKAYADCVFLDLKYIVDGVLRIPAEPAMGPGVLQPHR
jgi:hypothetical protein